MFSTYIFGTNTYIYIFIESNAKSISYNVRKNDKCILGNKFWRKLEQTRDISIIFIKVSSLHKHTIT